MEQYITYIAQFGFPIVMCLWFMFRTEKIISKNTNMLNLLVDVIENKFNEKKAL